MKQIFVGISISSAKEAFDMAKSKMDEAVIAQKVPMGHDIISFSIIPFASRKFIRTETTWICEIIIGRE